MDFLTSDLLIKVAVGGGVCFVVWRLLRPKYDLRIVLTPDGVQQIEGVAQRQRRELEEFLQQNLPESGRVAIGGMRQAGGRFRFVFRGPISNGQQQRFRNFFSTLS